jgi:transcriptional regulator with XRE-family HTH domain
MPKPLHQVIERTRIRRQITLAQLSEQTGIAESTVWRITKGLYDPRFATQLLPILSTLGLELADLIRKPSTRRKAKP